MSIIINIQLLVDNSWHLILFLLFHKIKNITYTNKFAEIDLLCKNFVEDFKLNKYCRHQ